ETIECLGVTVDGAWRDDAISAAVRAKLSEVLRSTSPELERARFLSLFAFTTGMGFRTLWQLPELDRLRPLDWMAWREREPGRICAMFHVITHDLWAESAPRPFAAASLRCHAGWSEFLPTFQFSLSGPRTFDGRPPCPDVTPANVAIVRRLLDARRET